MYKIITTNYIYNMGTSKKPQFSQASLINSIVADLSSPLSFSMLINGKVGVVAAIFLFLDLKMLGELTLFFA